MSCSLKTHDVVGKCLDGSWRRIQSRFELTLGKLSAKLHPEQLYDPTFQSDLVIAIPRHQNLSLNSPLLAVSRITPLDSRPELRLLINFNLLVRGRQVGG